MKTKEEILYEVYGCKDKDELQKYFSFSDKSIAMVVEAMEKHTYNELIKICKYTFKKALHVNYSKAELKKYVEKYLSEQ